MGILDKDADDVTRTGTPGFVEATSAAPTPGTPIQITSLYSGVFNTAASSFATTSQTPTANRLQLLAVTNTAGAAIVPASVVGCGLTWVLVQPSVTLFNNAVLSLWRALGAAPTAGAVTVNFGALTPQDVCAISWGQASGIHIGGSSGELAIRQVKTGIAGDTSTTLPLTFASALGDPANAVYASFAHNKGTEAAISATQRTNFTEVHDLTAAGAGFGFTQALETQWRGDPADNIADVTWSVAAWRIGGIAVELAVPTSPIITPPTIPSVPRAVGQVTAAQTGHERFI